MPVLPTARGPLSAAVLGALVHPPDRAGALPGGGAARRADPYGGDLQLALYACYELHYRGFDGVAEGWEWDPALLRLRGDLERAFIGALRRDAARHRDAASAVEELLAEPVGAVGASHHLRDEGTVEQMREYAAQRSLYHLKEADPHLWVIPRLHGRAKAAMAAVEYDEFGGGRAERIHAQLFADLMADLGLQTAYGRYLDAASAEMLAVVTMMSMLGLHRSLRGALVGHFAAVEITSSPASRRLAQAMARLGAGAAAEFFYTEHVTADAVHEQVVRREVIGGLLEEEPGLDRDIAFGIDATMLLEDRFQGALLTAWRHGRTSLRRPLAPGASQQPDGTAR